MNKFLPIILVTIIVVGGGAFYGGVKYAESKNPRGQFSRADFQNLSPEERRERLQELGANAGGSRGGLGGGQRGGAGGFITGGIISKDDRSVTIKLQDSGSKIVFLSDSTEITKFAEGTLTDLEVGKNISVNGAANPDGSLTAQTIQLRPRND
ncbi:MAG: hypothetical protein HY982_02725 [Candidatus Magasanikbacteria bacterium]|nr:hypothetical protein [Candidatus Magasanikbacteria bacterium]